MGEQLLVERYQWLDRQVRSGKYPNARMLAEKFEVTEKTAQRNIIHMRDRLRTPLEYDASRKGYFYTDTTFQLPSPPITQEELLAILLAQNMLSASAGGVISDKIRSFGQKLFASTGILGLTQERLNEAFSATWNEYAPAQGPVFQKAMRALLESRLLGFTYTSPQDQKPRSRTVEPHHLQHYMGSWGMIGYCHLRKEWRKFMLSRMKDVSIKDETFSPKSKTQWKNQLEGGFGIFQGKEPKRVTLRFNSFRAPWIREQVWHPDQIVEEVGDGSITLAFPVCDFREVKMKVLQFGAHVEVLEPQVLRDEIREDIQKMGYLYK